jgi:hypothetical protein
LVWLKPFSDPGQVSDTDLTLTNTSGKVLGVSQYGGGPFNYLDLVAIDSNVTPLGSYVVRTNRYQGSGGYTIGFADTREMMSGVVGSAAPVYTFAEWDNRATIRDVYLTGGQCFAVTARGFGHHPDGEMALMASDPGRPVQGRAQAAARVAFTVNAASVTLTYTAPRTGWYGLVLLSDDDMVYGVDAAVTYQRQAC